MARLQKRHLGTTASQKAFRSVSHSASQDSTQPLMRSFGALLMCALLAISTVLAPISMAVQSAWADDNALVIAIDPGHGGTDPGASGNGVVEKDANWAIAMACVNELNTYSGVKVVVTRTQNETVSGLDTRVQRAVKQGADVVISIHCNSVDGAPDANGVETFVPNDTNYLYEQTRVPGYGLGSAIQKKLVSLGFYDRTVKVRNSASGTMYKDASGKDVGIADYYGIIYNSRINGIPGIIVEHGFVSNASDAAKLKDSTWLTKIGVADATAIAEYYGLSKVPQNGSAVPDDDVTREGTEVVTEREGYGDFSIMGETMLSTNTDDMARRTEAINKMVSWYKSKNKTYPADVYAKNGAATIEDFCALVYDEAVAEGVRPEVLMAQAMKETGWLQFGGQVKNYQCNFGGIGALDGQSSGSADFSGFTEVVNGKTVNVGVKMGLRAQVQHLRVYGDKTATESTLHNKLIDPRFGLVTPGKAPNVSGLAKTWATAETYGVDLIRMINDLLGYENEKVNAKFSMEGIDSSAADAADGESDGKVTVYVDGVAKQMTLSGDKGTGTIELTGSAPRSVVMYEYKRTDDLHTSYPTGMSTWILRINAEGDYVTTRYYGLEDLLIYSGCSIRLTGTKGIRMITGMSSNVKTALASSAGIDGYKLVETGTLLIWSNGEGTNPTLSTSGAVHASAYVAGKSNPVYAKGGGIEYYTNVLKGDFTKDQCRRDLAMRPYAILKDKYGSQVVVYGGTLHRSISYIAQQNKDVYPQGSANDKYIEGLI